MLTQGTRYEFHSFKSPLNFSHPFPIPFSVHLGQKVLYCPKIHQSLGNSIGHLSVHTMELPGLCSDRSPLGPYDHCIRLNDAPPNKIYIVVGIPNFLDFFD